MGSDYLKQHPVLLILSIVPGVFAAVLMAAYFHPWVYKRIKQWRLPLIVTGYIVTRPVLFYIIFVALGNRQVGNDVACWRQFAIEALQGKFPVGLSPLFAYVLAAPCLVWNHIGASVLSFIVFDFLGLVLLCRLVRNILGADRVIDAAWLYVVNPAIWLVTVRYGQDECITAAFLMLAVLLYMQHNKWFNPFVLALGVLTSKITTVFGMFVVFTYSKRKLRDAMIACGSMLAVYALVWKLGGDLMLTFKTQGGGIEGLTFISLIDRLTRGAFYSPLHLAASVLSVLSVLVVCVIGHRRKLPILECVIAAMIAFLLFSPRAFKFYRLWFLGALAIPAMRRKEIGRYALYSGLLCVFDDFSFEPNTASALLYTMAAVGAVILYIELGYLFQLLRGGSSESVDTAVLDDTANGRVAPAVNG